jgi:cell division protein FtsB
MAGVRNPLSLIRRAALPAVAFLIIANFAGYAVVGDNGVLSWGDYRRQKAERSVVLAQLETERARLAHRTQLLDPDNADPDLAEEMVRRDLGYVRPDEVIVQIEGAPAPSGAPAAATAAQRR